MIKHIVMWKVRGDSVVDKNETIMKIRASFESLRGRIPGLLNLEIGADSSGVPYACDVVLYSEFSTQRDLDAYGTHPEHARVKSELANLRIERHQVDYAPDETLMFSQADSDHHRRSLHEHSSSIQKET